ncbi:MAG TPA: hypothetical protein VFT66_24210 [Roseiflexaceae bacterium]|jgi:hypothetical protein|nr:hypothetical protein [Roseiflexaceae bacterium]
MENIPDQRNVAPGTPAVAPQSVLQQPYQEPSAAPRPGRLLVLRRALRLLARRFAYGFVRLGQALRPYAAFLAIIVVLTGMVGVLTLALVWPSRSHAVADARVAALSPADSVENYLRGQHDANADLMWSAYSPDYQSAQLEKGASKQTLQTTLNQFRAQGVQFLDEEYVGGVPLTDGGTMYFYAVQVDTGQRQLKVPMTFLVNSDGKVEGIISPISNSSDSSSGN